MSVTKNLTHEALAGLVGDLLQAGTTIIAPAKAADGGTDYRRISRFDEVAFDGDIPRRSLRAVFQPPTETVFTWERTPEGVKLTPAPVPSQPQVILGARPCDAAGIETLDKVMDWEYRDDLWFARREATTVIGLACREVSPSCFCESLGGSPASTAGSDLLLHSSPEGYGVEVVTAKGEAFVADHAERFADLTAETPVPEPETALPLEAIREWLNGHFEDAFWQDLALRCLGCGACTSICPTCHCFDLVDEPEGTKAGTRRRNWDTCQTGLFTLHASGHNPRPEQTARCRQRVMHKFLVYPQRFGSVLCTGCGRCVNACPAGVSLPEILHTIADRAAQPAGEGA